MQRGNDMNIFDIFVEKVRKGEQSFSLEAQNRVYHVMSFNDNGIRYFYILNCYQGDIAGAGSAKPLAIKKDETIYILDGSPLGVYNPEATVLPKNVLLVAKELKKINNEVMAEVYREFMDSLPSKTITDKDTVAWAEGQARELVLRKDTDKPEAPKGDITTRRYVEIIQKGQDAKDVIREHFEQERDSYITIKAQNMLIAASAKAYNLVQPWEIEMAKTLRALEAQMVVVEFTKNGKSAREKYDRVRLLDDLVARKSISYYNFPTQSAGNKLLAALGYTPCTTGKLSCADISAILFRGKVIFERGVGR